MSRRQADHEILARHAALKTLLADFGVHVYATEPGVVGYYRPFGTRAAVKLDLGEAEWAWLEPLLRELQERRAGVQRDAPGTTRLGGMTPHQCVQEGSHKKEETP